MSRMLKKSKYNVAIVGATGAVGTEMLKVLEKRKFPMGELRLLASANSVGKTMVFAGKDIAIQELTKESFKNIDFALFSAGSPRSKEFASVAVKAGALVIDNSSAFRMDQNVPLVVPEINPDAAKLHQGIIANPNCTAIIMCMAIYPIHKINPIKRITVSTYQAVSGAGAKAVEELYAQQRQILNGETPTKNIFQHVIANNVFSHNTDIATNGYNDEENKIIVESRKILNEPQLQIAPTCIRVPIERAHSEAIQLELTHPVGDLNVIRQHIGEFKGDQIVDNVTDNTFPMPVLVSGQDDVLVGRIRHDLYSANTLHLFVCGDQLLKGAALNAVQIAELFL